MHFSRRGGEQTQVGWQFCNMVLRDAVSRSAKGFHPLDSLLRMRRLWAQPLPGPSAALCSSSRSSAFFRPASCHFPRRYAILMPWPGHAIHKQPFQEDICSDLISSLAKSPSPRACAANSSCGPSPAIPSAFRASTWPTSSAATATSPSNSR